MKSKSSLSYKGAVYKEALPLRRRRRYEGDDRSSNPQVEVLQEKAKAVSNLSYELEGGTGSLGDYEDAVEAFNETKKLLAISDKKLLTAVDAFLKDWKKHIDAEESLSDRMGKLSSKLADISADLEDEADKAERAPQKAWKDLPKSKVKDKDMPF